jgi:hypothetical protein
MTTTPKVKTWYLTTTYQTKNEKIKKARTQINPEE